MPAKKTPSKRTGKQSRAYRPNNDDRALVLGLAACGLPATSIACEIRNPATGKPISEKMLLRHYGDAVENAGAVTQARVLGFLYQLATGEIKGSPAAARYWLERIDRMQKEDAAMTECSASKGMETAPDDGLTDDERMERLMVLYERIRARLVYKSGDGAQEGGKMDPSSGATDTGAGKQGR